MKKIAFLFPVIMLVLLAGMLFPSIASAAGCSDVEIRDAGFDNVFRYTCVQKRVVQTGFWPWETSTVTTRTAQSKRLPSVYSTSTSRTYALNGRPSDGKRWRPDGCSMSETYDFLVIARMGVPSFVFKAACNEHDYCYATPGISKANCDFAFANNMAAICVTHADVGVQTSCSSIASVLYNGVFVGGQSSYDKAQKWASKW